MPRRTDIWRTGIVRAPAADILAGGTLEGLPIVWLPPGPAFTFLADPFGLWRDGLLHLFVEAYDYRDRIGRIDVIRLSRDLVPIDRRRCLAEPWHLSYPFVFEAEGETWMLPEAHRSGTLHLYRATDFPLHWEKVARFPLDTPAVDATPLYFAGRWWLFYAASGSKKAKQGHLHIASADRVTGPWTPHPANPVRVDRAGARPGGTPLVVDGQVVLPVQDCTATYGGAIRPLVIGELTADRFVAEAGAALAPPAAAAPFVDGLHTLSACGDVTLIDAKRIDRSLGGLVIDVRRRLGGARR